MVILNAWILDSMARNLDLSHIHLLPILFYHEKKNLAHFCTRLQLNAIGSVAKKFSRSKGKGQRIKKN